MRSVSKWVAGVLALLVVGLVITTQVVSQEKKEQPKEGMTKQGEQGGAGDMAEMMAKWKALNTPGPMHKHFERLAGKWDTNCKSMCDPNAPPTENKGKAEFTPMYGGRYVMSKYQGEMMNESFEGTGLDGYDNFKKKYVSVWVDSMSTGIIMLTGTADESGKVITYTGTMDDPMTGQKDKPMRMVNRWVGDDKFVMQWFENDPTGKEMKTMEIEYTRAK